MPRTRRIHQLIFKLNLNVTSVPRDQYRIDLLFDGEWNEVFNSDAIEFDGSSVLTAYMHAELLP